MRVCSFLPSATEILFALGLGDQVVGVTHECDHPPAARKKPVVVRSTIAAAMGSAEIDGAVRASVESGEGLSVVDADTLRRADPDLIVTQDLCDVCALPAAAVTTAVAGLPRRPEVISLKPERLADVLADIRLVGAATGRTLEAGRLVAELTDRVTTVGKLTARVEARPGRCASSGSTRSTWGATGSPRW